MNTGTGARSQSSRAAFHGRILAWRGAFRVRFGRLLARTVGPQHCASTLSPKGISRILVCRINERMGNAMFLTPLLQRLHEQLPQATLDLATSYPLAQDLFAGQPGMKRIIVFPSKGQRSLWRYLRALRQLRAERYDLVIDPVPISTSDRMALTLTRARYRLGFATDCQWAPLTHAVAPPPEPIHRAALPLSLLSVLGFGSSEPQRLWLPLGREELAAGRALIERTLGADAATRMGMSIGFLAHAKGGKQLEPEFWLSFWQAFLELEPNAVPIEFLPTPSSSPIDARFAALHVASPRQLTATIAATRLFIGGDTGPMHLASSTAVPTVALFRTTEPEFYRPLKSDDLVLDAARSTPRELALAVQPLWWRTYGPLRAALSETGRQTRTQLA
jgi:heptosyltransferase III